jgi:uncharacterized membrane protein
MNIKILHTVLLIGILFIYIIFSILSHYFFETNAYDLGIFNEALWNYSNL